VDEYYNYRATNTKNTEYADTNKDNWLAFASQSVIINEDVIILDVWQSIDSVF